MKHEKWPATLESLNAIRDFVEAFAVKAGVSPGKIMSVHLIVEELVVNIINYAYPKDDLGEIGIGIRISGNKILLSFIDTGFSFDPLKVGNPDIHQDVMEREIGGLGIFMVKKMADDVHYARKDGKNILTVTLNLNE